MALMEGANLQKYLNVCCKIVFSCVLSLSYDIDLRSSKIILRFS